jgi:hypothetical protein
MDETIVAVVTRRSVAISRSASQNASSRLILVLCPATTIDRLRTRDFCLWPSMKQHPITVAPVRYNRKIGEPRNHLCVCKDLVRLGPSGRPTPIGGGTQRSVIVVVLAVLTQRTICPDAKCCGRGAVTRFRCYAAHGRAAFPPDLPNLCLGATAGTDVIVPAVHRRAAGGLF